MIQRNGGGKNGGRVGAKKIGDDKMEGLRYRREVRSNAKDLECSEDTLEQEGAVGHYFARRPGRAFSVDTISRIKRNARAYIMSRSF